MKTHYINNGGGSDGTDLEGAPSNVARREFASRLSKMLINKGWNQSELARRCTPFMKGGGAMGRDNISSYVRGKTLPTPTKLDALCHALGCQPSELLPARGVPSVSSDAPAVSVRDAGNGNAWLQVNQALPWPAAIEVLGLLRKAGVD